MNTDELSDYEKLFKSDGNDGSDIDALLKIKKRKLQSESMDNIRQWINTVLSIIAIVMSLIAYFHK